MAMLMPALAGATTICDSVEIRFRVSKSALDPDFALNRVALDRIADSLKTGYTDSIYRLQKVLVIGGASPEGSVAVNQRLSERRARSIFSYLSRYGELPQELTTFHYLGRDWKGLREAVRHDENVPYREDALALLTEIIDDNDSDSPSIKDPLYRLKTLKGGAPYRYMLRNIFPDLRASKVVLFYEKIKNPARLDREIPPPVAAIHYRDTVFIHDSIFINVPMEVTVPCPPCPPCPWYAGVKTNLLYDAAAVPNIGVEFAFRHDWTVGLNWAYGWWSNNHRHRYWRVYGGELEVRKWFGEANLDKPMSGHHVGLYAQMVTYDFEFGGRGQMGGDPGKNIWNRANWGVGISYGYSLPIRRRLNLDFTLGVGYLGGRYHEYYPDKGCYVWQKTSRRHWIGPTKLEVSLVWLFGTGNVNINKR